MLSSVVNIGSVENNSFGTGFVIDQDEKGVYILTCKHVIEDVGTPVVEDILAKVVAIGDFVDLAVIHVNKLHLKALPLQAYSCDNLKVKVIGFSHFNQSINQKKHIKATLYQEPIELHSTEDDRFYTVRKIQSTEGYNFDRGNSGSPVICQETGEVIAILSNKEGSKIGYAVDIVYLKDIWQKSPSLANNKTPQLFTQKKETLVLEKKSLSRMLYLLLFLTLLSLFLGGYLFFYPTSSNDGIPPYKDNYTVINVDKDDTLNVREGKGAGHDKVGELPYNAQNIHLVSCNKNDEGKIWCNIQYGGLKGWVRAKYITIDSRVPSTTDTTGSIKKEMVVIEEYQDISLKLIYPSSVQRGESIILTAILKNRGNVESKGGVTLSFPQRPLLNYTIKSNNFKELKKHKIGSIIYNNHKNQDIDMETIHPIIKSNDSNWKQGEEHSFSIALKPPQDINFKKLRILVRGTLTIYRVVPKDGIIDQQAFASREISINIID